MANCSSWAGRQLVRKSPVIRGITRGSGGFRAQETREELEYTNPTHTNITSASTSGIIPRFFELENSFVFRYFFMITMRTSEWTQVFWRNEFQLSEKNSFFRWEEALIWIYCVFNRDIQGFQAGEISKKMGKFFRQMYRIFSTRLALNFTLFFFKNVENEFYVETKQQENLH